MNGTITITRSTTTEDKVWKSRTDKAKRYEECVKCGEHVLDNWYLRHVKKCVQDHPKGKELFEEASEIHRKYKIATLESKEQIIQKAIDGYKNPSASASAIRTLDEKLTQPTVSDQKLLNNFQKYTFKFGDMVDAVVTKIEDYGVFVNNINGNIDKQGLIKKSKVRNTAVVDLNTYFRVGDKVRAEVVEIRVDGKLGLSTKRSVLPTYPVENFKVSLGDKLEPLKEQIIMQSEVKTPVPPSPPGGEDKQLEEVITFVKGKIGLVSPEARVKIKKLLDTNGMFSFTMALAKVADIQLDVGLLFASEIEKQMGNRP